LTRGAKGVEIHPLEKPITMKVWQSTLRKIRIISAMTGETILHVLERLASEELARLQKQETERRKQPEK
jgi:hypothetical protein